jgi:hypothetical protein
MLFSLLAACDDYISFGDEITLPDDELPASDQLVISSILINTDTMFYLRADRAISFQRGYPINGPVGEASWPKVDENDLDIRLQSNGGDVATFQHIPEAERFGSRSAFDTIPWTGPVYPAQANYRSSVAGSVLQPGEIYRLLVDHPRLGQYVVEERMPSAITAGSAEVSGFLTNSANTTYRAVNLQFRDPPGEENYYLIQILQDSLSTSSSALDDSDPRTPDGERLRGALFLSDTESDGQLIELDFIAFLSLPEDRIVAVMVTSVSPGWYRFMESYQRYFELRQDLDDGLTEPFQLYSNIPDGFGYFGLGNQVIVPVD